MKYIIRKMLSAILPAAIIVCTVHGIINGFTEFHFYVVGSCGIMMFLLFCGKVIRKIVFFPIKLIRKVLFRF